MCALRQLLYFILACFTLDWRAHFTYVRMHACQKAAPKLVRLCAALLEEDA
jgi:hypothetical protein